MQALGIGWLVQNAGYFQGEFTGLLQAGADSGARIRP